MRKRCETGVRSQESGVKKPDAARHFLTPDSWLLIPGGRRGFTLLEMILALAIGLVLMTAVYMMLDTQFDHFKSGRGAIEEATLVRSILARIGSDVTGNLGPYDPKQAPDSTSTTASSSTNTAMPPADTSMSTVLFNIGVEGDGSTLKLSVTRLPREILGADKRRPDVGELPKVCDLRRIIYWMVEGKGLAYQEVKRVTGLDVDSQTDDDDQPIKYIPEVKSIAFQYWDGSDWTGSWASSTPGPDGDTPVGPPAAIEITIELQPPTSADGTEAQSRKYRHVINVPTGNNYSSQTQ